MATVKKLFSDAIQLGMKATLAITDNFQKATAYAALADSMAKTGLITANFDEVSESESIPEVKGKDSLKPDVSKPKSTPIPKKEKLEPEPKPKSEESEPEPESGEEWTDEVIEAKKEQIDFIEQLKKNYEEDTINECVGQFSEHTMKTLDEITPLNIDAFVAFMQGLIAQQE